MPALQTNFGLSIPVGYPGMIANGELQNRITRTAEDAGGVPFGRAVFRGAGDHGCTVTPTAAGLLGIAVVDHGQVRRTGQSADTYAQYDNVPIMQRGQIWVLNGAAAVADGEQVYVTPAGAYTNVVAGNVILNGWFFDRTVAAGAMVTISKNRG
jgi:hypothetical protein